MRTNETTAIEVAGLVKTFGSRRALDGVDLHARAGTVLGLLGPNGAGKTTTVRVLTTLLEPDAGTVRVAGVDVLRDPAALRERIGLAGQHAAVDDGLTGTENLVLVGRLHGLRRGAARERAAALLDQFGLAEVAGRVARTYSGGTRRRLDLAAALVARPQVLFLDEPTTGLDPRARLDLWAAIEALVAEGTTVLLTTQYLDEAERLADRIAVVDRGRVIAGGTADELKARVGGERIEVRVAEPEAVAAVAGALARIAAEPPWVEGTLVSVAVSAGGRVAALLEAARVLRAEGAPLEDVAIRRPTLDDVFLTLTGDPVAAPPAPAPVVAAEAPVLEVAA
jgi:ABC-2 type transport system ATP-binding protein